MLAPFWAINRARTGLSVLSENMRCTQPAIAAAVLAALLAACSGTKHPSQTARPSTSSAAVTTSTSAAACGTTTTGGANGGGKETNPPGDIPDNQAFVKYSPAGGGYSIEIPEGWARTETAQAADFTDKFNHVRVELSAQAQPPTVQTAQSTEVPKLAATVRCFARPQVTTAVRRGGTAVLITYQATSDPDPVTGKVVTDAVERYEFWRGGRAAVITLSGALGSDNVDPWRRVTDSFAWQ